MTDETMPIRPCEACGSPDHGRDSGPITRYIDCLVQHLSDARLITDAAVGRAVRLAKAEYDSFPVTRGGMADDRRNAGRR